MSIVLADAALDQVFREARTHQWFDGRPVSMEQLRAIWDLATMAPTSMNQQPVRIVWCQSQQAKDRLASHAAAGNVDQIKQSPVCAIIAYDVDFHEHMAQLFPHADAKAIFGDKPELRQASAVRNGTLQGAYLIMAARALGLDCGPMSGFDNAAVDADFFADEPSWKSNFICSIGYGDAARLHQRLPRPAFDQFNRLL